MRFFSIILATISACASFSCAGAEPSLSDAVTVEKIDVALPEWILGESASSYDRAEALVQRERFVRDAVAKLDQEQQAQTSIVSNDWTGVVKGTFPNRSRWAFRGRASLDRSVYIAYPLSPESLAPDRSEVEVCRVVFDPSAMPDRLEMRHYRLLYAVLIEGECSSRGLDLASGELREDLSREIEGEQFEVFAQRRFNGGVEATIISEVYARGQSADTLGMIAAFLGFERLRQSQIGEDKGLLTLRDGSFAKYRTAQRSGNSVCVIHWRQAADAVEGAGADTSVVQESEPAYRRFCREQLEAADEAYTEKRRQDWEQTPGPTTERQPLPMPGN